MIPPIQNPCRASALLLITGLVSILAVLAAVFLLRTREDASAAQPLVREAQARIMLSAACLYLLESSRMGWGSPGHGWVDNRNGSIGPRPPRSSTAGDIPQPTWWRTGGYPFDDSEGSTPSIPPKVPWDDYGYTQIDPAGGNDNKRIDYWPHPGGACRCEMARWLLPPYATTAHFTMNPVMISDDFLPGVGADYSKGWTGSAAMVALRTAAMNRAPMFLQPQPVADVHGDKNSPVSGADFISGKRTISGVAISSPLAPSPLYVPETINRAWFRVYRELPSEHDGKSVMVGTLTEPYFDTVALSKPDPVVSGKYLRSSDGVFIITCGGGATGGYRSWQEVANCGATQRFGGDQNLFHRLRSQERILWYRVCWSGNQGGSYNAQFDVVDVPNYPNGGNPPAVNQSPPGNWSGSRSGVNTHAFGTFSWIQRLPSEPPRW